MNGWVKKRGVLLCVHSEVANMHSCILFIQVPPIFPENAMHVHVFFCLPFLFWAKQHLDCGWALVRRRELPPLPMEFGSLTNRLCTLCLLLIYDFFPPCMFRVLGLFLLFVIFEFSFDNQVARHVHNDLDCHVQHASTARSTWYSLFPLVVLFIIPAEFF
jgi:hypothetical protein